MLRELLGAIVFLLGEHETGLARRDRRLALRDLLLADADENVGEIGLGDRLGGARLVELGDELGVVDDQQKLARCDIVASLDRTLSDQPVDARRNIDPRRVRLALHDQRLCLEQIPERKAGDDRHDHEQHDRCASRRLRRFRRRRLGGCFVRASQFGCRHVAWTPRRIEYQVFFPRESGVRNGHPAGQYRPNSSFSATTRHRSSAAESHRAALACSRISAPRRRLRRGLLQRYARLVKHRSDCRSRARPTGRD